MHDESKQNKRAQTEIIETNKDLSRRFESVPLRGQYTEHARQKRVEFLTTQSGLDLKWITTPRLPAEFLQGNIENYVGSVEIPIGIAGPLLIKGKEGEYLSYPPLATTEGALVSSVSRGSRAISESGGCRAHVISQCMVRAPVFKFSSIDDAVVFIEFIRDNFEYIRREAESISRHAILMSVDTEMIGRIVHTRFVYETGDAAGQNMTTKCTDHACKWLIENVESQTGLHVVYQQIEGNTGGDKKICNLSKVKGRGIRVTTEIEISDAVCRKVLSVDPDKFYEGYQLGVSGGIASGMTGYNINVANVIAAIFTATGQDIACVHESSIGHLHVERISNGLYASMTLPNLVIGIVGGGTSLPGQREMLEYLGCDENGNLARFAEIICSTCLALDLSTMAAVSAGHFASAHARLGSRSAGQ